MTQTKITVGMTEPNYGTSGSVLTGGRKMTMADREKVIKGLECCTMECTYEHPFRCKGCPYSQDDAPCEALPVKRDALALLKEQEAVEPTLIREGRNKHYNDYVCPRCDNEVVYEQNYCSECGIPFLWEGR